ncbi:uncharacterized protein SAPINGB_P004693 [Magnusiomyces paraingens]|uniref:Aquaporin n=1 Tax=Magnusiomyces paraingens TaxID=2606893 RepID=A0A5E8C169_9ASCO|nr:uncharacterized protein SAPINGB_P004693 [Saprochaete ingens]VVT55690.1 unnamed protein product [Saprochaete ingens]
MSETTYCDTLENPPFWPRIRHKFREPFAEFLGTFILILFGDGVVAQVVLSSNKNGSYQSISWCWGIGVMFGVYVSGGISGGHLNPAVTFANCVLRKFPWKKLPIYVVAQLLGAFCAAFVVYGNYKSAFDYYAGMGVRDVTGDVSTAGIFCTYPASFMTRTGMVFSEIIGSSILMLCIYAINDSNNMAAGPLGPLILFFLIFGIGASFGWETGYAINPARDFGPRMASYILGYGPKVFTAGGTYFWIPIVCPVIGCTFGGFLYDLFIYTGTESPINQPYFGITRLANKSSKNEDVEKSKHNDRILAGFVHGHSEHPVLETVTYADEHPEHMTTMSATQTSKARVEQLEQL